MLGSSKHLEGMILSPSHDRGHDLLNWLNIQVGPSPLHGSNPNAGFERECPTCEPLRGQKEDGFGKLSDSNIGGRRLNDYTHASLMIMTQLGPEVHHDPSRHGWNLTVNLREPPQSPTFEHQSNSLFRVTAPPEGPPGDGLL